MTLVSLTLPTVGLPVQTEDPKITSDFTILQTTINGLLDDTNLASPMAAVRKTLLSACGTLPGGSIASDNVLGNGTAGLIGGGGNLPVIAFWAKDTGLSGQPQGYQVAGKTLKARTRATLATNGTAPGVTFKVGAYAVTAMAGTANNISIQSAAVIAGSQVTFTTPAINTLLTGESAEWTVPNSLGVLILGFNTNGTTPANSVVSIAAELLGYNT